jgi:hypothetical protein
MSSCARAAREAGRQPGTGEGVGRQGPARAARPGARTDQGARAPRARCPGCLPRWAPLTATCAKAMAFANGGLCSRLSIIRQWGYLLGGGQAARRGGGGVGARYSPGPARLRAAPPRRPAPSRRPPCRPRANRRPRASPGLFAAPSPYVPRVLRLPPVLQVLEIIEERGVLEVAVLRQPWGVWGRPRTRGVGARRVRMGALLRRPSSAPLHPHCHAAAARHTHTHTRARVPNPPRPPHS